jgi:hypothetical protein
MNIIGIDPSLISTAVAVNGKLINYCREEKATLSKGGLTKWFKMCESELELNFINFRTYENYSDGELIKLKDYDKITNQIISDIEKNIDKSKPTRIGIEGYSYASDAGDIIDLVTFSTLLRKKLYDYISQDIIVMAPSTLKQETCKLTYAPINEGKKKEKWVYKNNDGVSGGSFTKHGMYLAIIENESLTDPWAKLCKTLKTDLMGMKMFPKPFEDVDDAYLIYNILKNKL